MTVPQLREVQQFTRDSLPLGEWQTFRKLGTTKMVRVNGPFACTTIDGNVVICQDGWLALDPQGHPYPVAAAVHEDSYEPAEDEA